MLVTLFLLLNAPLLYAAKVILCQDPSIVYSSGWYTDYSTPTEDIYLETNQTDASLKILLPINASSVYYVGYRRTGGSLYGYCIDCAGDGSYQLLRVNASDPAIGTDEAAALQSIIFNVTLDPSTQHTLTVYNLPDKQFNNSGKINFDHLLVQAPDETTADIPPFSSIPTSGSVLSTPTVVTDTSAASPSFASATPVPSSKSSSLPSSASIPSTTVADPGSISPPSTAVNSALPSPTVGDANAASSSAAVSKTSAGLSKSMTIGVAVLSSLLGISIIVGLVVFLRQRRERRRNRFQAAQSPRASIIPIMPPPTTTEIRTAASANPFADPVPRVESPARGSLMQRRMESRNASPTQPPSIPLPEPPSESRTESRSDSPSSSSFARSDLWIARPVQTPLRSKFSV